MRDSPSKESQTSLSPLHLLYSYRATAVGLRAPLPYTCIHALAMRPPAQPLSPCDHVTSTPQRTQVTVSPMGIASDHHSTDAEVRHSASHGYTNGNVPRPEMDTWNVKACLFGRAGWPARLREPECPPSEQCKGSCVPRRRLEEGTPMHACHGPARTRRASATRSTGTCSTGKPTSAAIASKGVRWGRRGSVDGITSKPMVAACEAVLPYYLNWNAGFCCYSLRRGPLGHDAERCGDGCRRRR